MNTTTTRLRKAAMATIVIVSLGFCTGCQELVEAALIDMLSDPIL